MRRNRPSNVLNRKIALGVDVGGTWLRTVALDESGRVLAKAKTRAPGSTEPLAPVLRRLLRRWRVRPNILVVGSRGMGTSHLRSAARRDLRTLARRVLVLPDLETARLAALGVTPGVLILAGTGSCACGRDGRGHFIRAGGLGPLLGDEGSAFWIGREWVKTLPPSRALALAHRPDAVRATAALAVTVLARAGKNPAARRIIRGAQKALVSQAETAARRLRLRGKTPISWHGGLFRDREFRQGFLRRLRRSRMRWLPVEPKTKPEFAAASLGLGLCKRAGVLRPIAPVQK